MTITRTGMSALAAVLAMTAATAADAGCTRKWADVTIFCPHPVPYPGPKHLTPTSRNMPTVGTPGLYKNWGNGYDVQVHLGHNGTGYQDFNWTVPNDYGKPGH